jgi:hypothetical protein
MRGYNDDLVMALAIGLWVRDTALRLRQEGIDLTRKQLDGISFINTYMLVFMVVHNEDNPWKCGLVMDMKIYKWL